MNKKNTTVITKALLRFTRQTPSQEIESLQSLLMEGATYKLTLRFHELENPELVQKFLEKYCLQNPFSVLDIVLESGSPEACQQFINLTNNLKLSTVPFFEIFNKLPGKFEMDYPSQITRYVLCPWQDIPRMTDKMNEKGIKRWALVSGTHGELKSGIEVAIHYRWTDGILIRKKCEFSEEQLFLPLYLHFVFRDSINLHFEDPHLDMIYRTCILQEPITRAFLNESELHYSDSEGIRLIQSHAEPNRSTIESIYQGIITIMGSAMEMETKKLRSQ